MIEFTFGPNEEDVHTSLEAGFLKLAPPQHEARTTLSSSAPQQSTSSPAGVNTNMDVLCGRSKLSHSNKGNIKYRAILENHRKAYQTAPSRDKKSAITRAIISDIQRRGGRFLIFDKDVNEFVDADDDYVHEKVSKALRSAKDPNRYKYKKPREVIKHVPTHKENAAFEFAVKDQQRIFQALVERESKTKTVYTLSDDRC